MNANTMQIGGNHYRSGIQHWDLMDDYRVGYLESAATKYITRWRNKDGVKDLQKALHFVKKLAEKRQDAPQVEISARIPQVHRQAINKYLESNHLTGDEADIISHLLTWQSTATLHLVCGRIQQLINGATPVDDDAEASIGYVNQDR
jgi:hypothetical protein